jgi:hypothetical protein
MDEFDVGTPHIFSAFSPASMAAGIASAQESGYTFTQVSKSLVVAPTLEDLQNVCGEIANQTQVHLPVGTLLRDFGNELNFFIGSELAIRYRLCQQVSNAETFGNSGIFLWVPVYLAALFPTFEPQYTVGTARTGSCVHATKDSAFFVTCISGGYIYSPSSIPNGLAAADLSGYAYTQPSASIINTTTVAEMQNVYQTVYDQSGQNFTAVVGTVYKDLGKTVDFTVNGNLAVRWQLVQRVQGAGTEGCPSAELDVNGNPVGVYYVATYVADQGYYDEPVVVARSGSSISNTPEMKFFVHVPSLQAIDVSGSIYFNRSDIQTGIDNAIADGVPVTQNNSIVSTTSISDMQALYGFVKDQSIEGFEGNTPPFLLRDMGQNIDFLINGLLAIRLRLVQFMYGPSSEGVDTAWNVGDTLYVPIFVSDSATLPENVQFVRLG